MKNLCMLLPGILLCIAIASLAFFLSQLSLAGFAFHIIGAPVLAIFVGLIISLFYPKIHQQAWLKEGVRFSSRQILQFAVITLGFSLNLSMIATVGSRSLPIITSSILISLVVAWFLMKQFHMPPKLTTLIGVGSAICGGSAIAATAPVIEADDQEVAQAVATIFIFNVLAALIFPNFGYWLGLGTEGFAIFAGSAINDTSSVTAAASIAENLYLKEGILSAAVTVKLTRTLAIIPISLFLSYQQRKQSSKKGNEQKASITQLVPRFIIFFCLASLLTSLIELLSNPTFLANYHQNFLPLTKNLAKFLIAMAMAAIGLSSQINQLIKEGKKPILLGLACWVSITLVSLMSQLLTGTFYSMLP